MTRINSIRVSAAAKVLSPFIYNKQLNDLNGEDYQALILITEKALLSVRKD